MSTRRTRRGERGQVMVITALLATVLIGAAALAIDLSVQTGNRRAVQNVTDVAALAGARDLYTTSTTTISSTDQGNAVADALTAVQRDMGWPDSWLTDAGASLDNCPAFPPATFATYGLHGYCEQVHYGSYTITASTPPMSPRTSADMDPHNVQVDMTQSAQNGLAGVIGFSNSQQGGHAVAGHMPAGVPIDFALFSNSVVQAGNQAEIATGNVYANRAVQPQSSGGATFCAQGSGGSADDGYVILASPQTAASGGQPSVNQAQRITAASSCSTLPGSGVYQTGAGMQGGTPTCPSISGMPDLHLSYDSTVGACVTLPLVPPSAAPPPLTGNVVQISGACRGSGNGGGHRLTSCWTSSSVVLPGLYVVNHNSGCSPPSCWDLLINGSLSLSNVTFWLKAGAAMEVSMNGGSGTVTDSGPYNGGTYVVYGDAGSSLHVDGNGTGMTFTTGSIFMPAGTVAGGSSTAQLLVLGGQAVTDTWQISTGNQNNPAVVHNAAFDAVSQETLRLLE